MVRLRFKPKRVAQCAVLLVAGPAFLFLGSSAVRDDLKLQRTGVVAQADVYDWRIESDKSGPLYELRYTFAVPGRPIRYSHSDLEFDRQDLWVAVAPAVWEASRQSNQIDVRYMPDDPRVNRPVGVAGDPWVDMLAALVCGVLSLATGALMLLVAAVQYRRCRRNPPPDGREYLLFTAERAETRNSKL